MLKVPTSSWRYPWYSEWNDEIALYAAEHGISYYNLLDHADDIGIDMTCDSYDGGLHLNVAGAEKVSTYFGEILSREHGVSGEKNKIWDAKVNEYYNERN